MKHHKDRNNYCCGYSAAVWSALVELFGFVGEDFGGEAVGFECLLRQDGRGRGECGYRGIWSVK